ncbi:Transmembrane protein [Pleurotus pulmonarius]
MTSPFTYLLDDSDPRILYSLGWLRGGLPPEFNGSTTYTDSRNETMTVTFVGTSISVFGSITNSTVTSTYEVDGTTTSKFSMDPKGERRYRVLFYESPALSHKKHTLVATSEGGRVIIDYITITSTLPNTFSACVTELCSSMNVSASTSTTSAAPANVGAIVGGVFGGFALVGLLYVIWRLCRQEAIRSDAMIPRPYDVGVAQT